MLVPINQEEEYARRALLFASMSDQELLDDYQRMHGFSLGQRCTKMNHER